MNLAFVYNRKDAELALQSAKAIAACGMNYNHKATVCCEEPTPYVAEITETLKEAFPVVGRIVAQDGFEGWPLGPNQMFVDCSTHFYSSGELWFFWEPDCVPVKERWLDKLQEDYDKNPAIMGSVNKSGVCRNGKIMYEFINGSAVYPANFLDFCPLARNLHSYNLNYRALNARPDPWDVYCRWEFMKIGRNTDLIRSYWKTKNYRIVEGRIVFDAEDEVASEALDLNCPELTVDNQAVVVHGCKDGTLHKLVVVGGGGQSVPLQTIPAREWQNLMDSVDHPNPESTIPAREPDTSLQPDTTCHEMLVSVQPMIQNITKDGLSPNTCNKTSDKMQKVHPSAQVGTVCNKSPSKANKKKKRNLSPEERQRRSNAMKAILARKAERKAQGVV